MAQLSYFNFLTCKAAVCIMWMPINLTFMHQNIKNFFLPLCALNITGEEAGQSKNMN